MNFEKEKLDIILQVWKTLLFYQSKPWVKNSDNEDVDVPMGCYDSAEVCELVGTFILSKLKTIININDIGLYRDDGLGILRNMSGPKMNQIRKKVINVFKQFNLSITVQMNIKIVDYLDGRLDLHDKTYRPYRKPNNNLVYIHKESNHPPLVIKQLPLSISKRISDISSNENVFDEASGLYENALKRSGFNDKIKDINPTSNNNSNTKKHRKRKTAPEM